MKCIGTLANLQLWILIVENLNLFPDSELNVFEGSACVSDDNGNLLFYTDGLNIWDATNTVMPNGAGLMGGATSNSTTCTMDVTVIRFV